MAPEFEAFAKWPPKDIVPLRLWDRKGGEVGEPKGNRVRYHFLQIRPPDRKKNRSTFLSFPPVPTTLPSEISTGYGARLTAVSIVLLFFLYVFYNDKKKKKKHGVYAYNCHDRSRWFVQYISHVFYLSQRSFLRTFSVAKTVMLKFISFSFFAFIVSKIVEKLNKNIFFFTETLAFRK